VNDEPATAAPLDKISWTDERVDLLKRLWADGLTASQIAARFGQGVTRNAVIGKVHRLGLSGRVTKARPVQPKPQRKVFDGAATRLHPMVQGATALKPQARPAPKPEPEPEPIRLVEMPAGERCTILMLNERTCRWPIGDPGSETFSFCGGAPRDKGPYCEYHARIAYQPMIDRRRVRLPSKV
jgi:GcrA cell cycle regulator